MSNSSLNRKVKINLPRVKLSTTAKNFSLKQLLLFGLIFAAIGGYFLWQAFAATNLPTWRVDVPSGGTGYWLWHNSPTTQIIGTDGNGFRQRVIVWDTAGGQPTAFYSGKRTYAVLGFRLITGNPGRLFDWHTQPNDQPYSWTPYDCDPSKGGRRTTGVAPLAIDYNDSRGMRAALQAEDWSPCDPGSGTYHYPIFTQAEIEARRGQWVWLWMEITWGRSDLPTDGSLKIWVAGEDTPRVSASNVNTHWWGEHQVNFLQGVYWSSGTPTVSIEHAAARFGRTPREAFEDVPVFHSAGGTTLTGGPAPGSHSAIAPRLSTEAAIPLSLQWSGTPGAPTVSLSANPTSISSGASSTLTWSSANATSCTASGAWTGTKATSGTQSVSPTATSIYNLSCTGSGGTATASATVTVSNTTAPTFTSSITDGSTVTNGTLWTGSSTPAGSSMEFWSDGIMLSTDSSAPFEQVINLSVGSHRLGLCTWISGTRYCYPGGVIATVNVVDPPPSISCPAPATNAWTGCYYDNADFTNLKVTRTDPAINFTWEGDGVPNSPDPSIGIDTFSSRWQGIFNFDDATYNFTSTTDDGMRVYIDNQLILDKWFDQPPTTHTVNKAITAGTHTVKVEHYDNGGGATAKLSWTKQGDTTPPSQPANLTASAASSSQINLSWSASTDNVAVSGYYIVRNGTTIASTSGTGTTYTDTSLSASTTYTYQVIAADAAGNNSPASNSASATTPAAPDTTPPSAPSNLSANAVSSSQINLSWTASTDNVGVSGYDIYRDSTKIATVTTTSYGNTGLASSTTYSYHVIARDAAGNSSSPSNTASATTQAAQTITTGNLNGLISSSSGGNIPGRPEVSLLVNGATRTYRATSQGAYFIPDLPAATYSTNYSGKFHAPTTRSTTITSGTTTTLNVTLQSTR